MRPAARPVTAVAPRGARRWLLWLVLLLAAAHCLATWHVYSHGAAQQIDRPSKSGHAGPDSCVLCLAVAGIGGAPTAAAVWHLTGVKHPAPLPLADRDRGEAPAARPYAIRAPPSLVS